jgi:hypothetical protein
LNGSQTYVDEPTGRAAVTNGAFFKVQGSGDVATYEYQRINSTTSVLVATFPSLNAAAPAYSLFPDAFFRSSAAQGASLVVNGKDYIPTPDGVKTWSPEYLHPLGKGAFKVLGTGSVAKFRVWFNSTPARQAGITTGTSLVWGFLAIQTAGQLASVAGRFIDDSGAYVGTQTGTKASQVGTGAVQVFDSVPATVPAGATGLEIWAYAPSTTFYVLDCDCSVGSTFSPSARYKSGLGALYKSIETGSAAAALASASAYAADTVTHSGITDVSGITTNARTARNEAENFSGFGQTFITPATISFNAIYLKELQRGIVTTSSRKWTRLKVAVRTHATDSQNAGAAVVARGEIRIPPNQTSLADLVIPLRSIATGDLMTVTQANLLATWSVMFEANSETSKATAGDARGTTNEAVTGAKLFSYYVTYSNDIETGTYQPYSGNPTISIGICTLSSPVITTVYYQISTAKDSLVEGGLNRRNGQRLRRFRSTAAKLKGNAAPAGRIVYAVIGDSWVRSSSYFLHNLTKQLIAEYGDGGVGFFGFGSTTIFTAANGDARGLYYPKASTGAWTFNYHAGSTSPDTCDARSSVAASTLSIGNIGGATHPALSSVKLHFTGTADGVIKWRWNGGAYSANTNVQGGIGVQQNLTLTGYPAGALAAAALDANLLEIEVVSGSVILCGIDIQSTTNGICFHKLGASGAKASDWLGSDATQWQAGFAALAPNACQIMLGVNDQAAAVGAAAYASGIGSLATRARAAMPSLDVLAIAPPETPAGYATKMSDYAIALSTEADLRFLAYLNLQPVFGVSTNPAEYASGGSIPMFADLSHPNTDGGPATAGEIKNMLLYG